MKTKETNFQDPKGKFSIRIGADWKYNNVKENVEKNLYQFEVSKKCVFQISYKNIDEHISKIIINNKIVPHDFNLPTISFIESHHKNESSESYIWMAVINDLFFLATYYFDLKIKPIDKISLDLMGIRLNLQHISIFKMETTEKVKGTLRNKKSEKDKDYLDIENWRNIPLKFLDKSKASNLHRISPLDIEPIKLYALLKCKISNQPNGFFDLLRIGLPLENMIWWDFVLECDKGTIQVWRTIHILEATCDFEGEFDLKSFFELNIEKYSVNIEETIKGLERHTIYINHYQSYKECVESLWSEIRNLNINFPESPKEHVLEDENQLLKYQNEIRIFLKESIKFHALAKSLVLNAAFKIESYLNLITRIGCRNELKAYPEILDKFFRQDFTHRLKNLRFYTQIFQEDFDLSGNVYRDAKELMTLRNKYVHYEEDTVHNKLGEIYYDRFYPLHPTQENRPAIESIKQTYLNPSIEQVKKAFETSNQFVEKLESLIIPEYKRDLQYLVGQNPIGYNETKGMYSLVYKPISIDFFTNKNTKK